MDNSKKLIRSIMICTVLAAVVIGLMYYYHETQDKSMAKQGTLIAVGDMRIDDLWQQ